MSTIASEIEPQGLSLPEYLAIGRRRLRSILLAGAIGLAITALAAVFWPPTYESKATILIEQQEIPQDLVRSTVSSYADERVQVISKRVMTTQTLLDIIRRFGLYPRQRASSTREQLLKRMRSDIGLKMISADVIDPRSGRPTEATIAFEVSYRSSSPQLAAKVANELTTLYLNENLTNRTEVAREATEFLQAEGDRIDKQIADLETKLEQFKKKNYSMLPEVTPLNMQLLDRTGQELLNAEEKETSLEQQRVFLEAQLAQLKPNSVMFSDTGERILSSRDRLKMLRSQLAAARAKYAPDYPDIVSLQREVAGLEREVGETPSITNDLRRELEDASARLAEARKRYGPDHPDRVRLEREVASLQAQLTASQPDEAPKESSSAAVADTPGSADPILAPTDADNPAYVQIKAQLSATLNDLKSQADEIAKLRAQEDSYQRDVSLAPAVEKEYRDLNRDYDSARLKYQEIRSKQSEARTAQDLEADREGERFTLIDPPLVPEQPASPNRVLVLVIGVILSLGLAAGVVWLLERLDKTIRTRVELLRLVGVPPLALVPHIGTEGEHRAARRRRQFVAAGAVASVCLAVLLVHLFYEPLDVLWFTWARRLGL